jgi:hypothetical protein
VALDLYRKEKGCLPKPWNLTDARVFYNFAMKIAEEKGVEKDDLKEDGLFVKFFHLFPMMAQGVFNPLCAFMGGFVSQEAVKAIT